MRSRSKSEVASLRLLALGFLSLAFVLMASPAGAAERSVSDVVLVDTGAVISDDLYAAGNRVVIAGRVEGDLVVAAYEDVTITGTVTGDVSGVAASFVISGSVGESVRAVTTDLEVTGEVAGDVLSLAGDTLLAGEIHGEAVVWGWAAEVAGRIGGDLEGQTRRLHVGGQVGGDVDVTTNRLSVAPGAVVGRDLGYRSNQVATGLDQAEVGGAVVHRLPLPPNIRVRALMILAKVVLGLLAAVVGLLVIWALPGASARAIASVGSSWWKAWLRGIGVLALPVGVVALALLLGRLAPTEGILPLLGVFLPVFIAVLGLVMAVTFAAPAAVYPWAGRLGNARRGPVRAFLYAAAAVVVLSLVPWFTWLILLILVPIGIGGWMAPPPAEQPA